MEISTIKSIIEDILGRMSVAYEDIEITESGSIPRFLIKTKDSSILIGARGEHLSALNHLVKKMANKKLGRENVRLSVDVNDYLEAGLRDVRIKASMLAERARSFKTEVEMEPMTPYERMFIHSMFEDSQDIKTESRGVGKNRRVVIKYVQS